MNISEHKAKNTNKEIMRRKIRDLGDRCQEMERVTRKNFSRIKKHREQVFEQTENIPHLSEESDLQISELILS